MDEYGRNQEIRDLLDIWAWCSRTLHVKWKRKPKYRNDCLVGIADALNESQFGLDVCPYELPLVYKSLPTPLFDEAGLLKFWEVAPAALFEMAVGCFTKGSPLTEQLNQLRLTRQDNAMLDKLFKKMDNREERYGFEWPTEGHHPESDFTQLKMEMAPLGRAVKQLILRKPAVLDALAHEVLAQGPWQIGGLSAHSFVRKTPESLLNRAIRLKLWLMTQEILSQGLERSERLQALGNGLNRAITPPVKAAIESQGYRADDVVDDFMRFDMRKSRKEITQKQAN